MSELIKENESDSMITMARHRRITFLGIAIMTVFFLSVVPHTTASHTSFILGQDGSAPDIWQWGIEGQPELGQGFDVWANVSDIDGDLKNVTVRALGPNMTINNLLIFNGTLHIGSVPPFPNDGTFTISIRAFDLANNSRTSGVVQIVYDEDPPPPIDPYVTLPIVVSSGFGLIVLAIAFAISYDKKKSAAESMY